MALGAKMMGLALSAAAITPALFTNDLTTPVIGVPVTTIAGAVLGTYAAIGYDESVRPRGKLFSLAISTVIMASMAAGVVPRLVGWGWANDLVEGGFAGLAAVIAYYLLPPALKRGGELIREFKWGTAIGFWKHRKGVTPGLDDVGDYPPVRPGREAPPTEEDPNK